MLGAIHSNTRRHCFLLVEVWRLENEEIADCSFSSPMKTIFPLSYRFQANWLLNIGM